MNGFEHKLLKFIRDEYKSFERLPISVACSGGADSVALIVALNGLKPLLKCKLKLLHIHHGVLVEEGLNEQNSFRDKALVFCRKLSDDLGVEFLNHKSEKALTKEEECREYRNEVFKNYENVFLAHHRNDFLETVLLRLIRGTGAQGLLNPFSNNTLYRPFLNLFSKKEILLYLKEKNQQYLNDPSNFEENTLRNWVRNSWLKDLEKTCGISGLSKSVHLISEALNGSMETEHSGVEFQDDHSRGFLKKSLWFSMSQFQKQSTTAHILLKTVKKGYTKGHIDEVVKLLNSSQKHDQFKVCGVNWTKDQDSIIFVKS